MGTMTDETYNGYANRETWAFNLHWQNDQGLYNAVLEDARDCIDGLMLAHPDREVSDTWLGERAVDYVGELMAELLNAGQVDAALNVLQDVGSFWRIDHAEVGEAVRESLGIESD